LEESENTMNRRDMIRASVVGTLGASTLSPGLASASIRVRRDDSEKVQAAVDSGVAYFRQRCDEQMPSVNALVAAIASGNVDAAKKAYIDSRPPYEEIETIAGSFEESDADIDARPYSFDGGETDPEFRGFHKIENLVFAEENLPAALPYAERLVISFGKLRRELDQPERFSAEGQFGGMVALTTEVAAKKVSSEEETWSDQSLLIFKHNWIGAWSQFKPFGDMVGADSAQVRSVAAAHAAAQEVIRPYFTKDVVAAAPYSSVPIKVRRAIADASNRYRDAIIVVRDQIGVPA